MGAPHARRPFHSWDVCPSGLGPLFRGQGGRRATEAELRQLLAALGRSGWKGPTAQVVTAQPASTTDRTPTTRLGYRLLGLPAEVVASHDTPIRVSVQLRMEGVSYVVEGVDIYVTERIPPSAGSRGRGSIRFYFARDWSFEGTRTVFFGGEDHVYTYGLD